LNQPVEDKGYLKNLLKNFWQYALLKQEGSMKRLKVSILFIAILSAFALILTGCGGGGGGDRSTISGLASKGPISGGTVTVFALNADGSKGNQLGTATTGADGMYSVNIGSYTGNVLVEVTGGTYTDEATGDSQTNTTLRAALSGVSGKVSVAVTPLTEIAYQLIGSTLSIDQANSLISSMIGINIVNTMPVDVTSAEASSKATVDQINYGLMLATISQMVKDGKATDVSDAISKIKNDLLDNKLDTTGSDLLNSLTTFIASGNNHSGVTTLGRTKLDDAIKYIAENPITPPADTTNLNKAKALVADLRNTVLSIYNYQGVGVPGVVETPFKNLSEELKTKIEPELTATVDRIAWIIESAGSVEPGTTGAFTKDAYVLTITIFGDGKEANFKVEEGGTTIDSGTLTLNDPDQPTSGTFNATMKTASGNLEASLNYSATVSGGSYTSMTFTGFMTASAVGVSLDFSQSGRKLSAAFAKEPESEDPKDIYPTSIYLSGRITTTTAQMDGTLNISSIVWNSVSDQPLPKSATFDGSFQELKDGSTTGVKFAGKITGSWDNAETYNTEIDESSDNFPKWNASFDGKIEAPSRPTITAFLKVAQSEYKKYAIDVNYRRTNTDETVVFLTGNGSYNDTTKILAATLSNQDGMIVTIAHDDTKSNDEEFSGTIKTSGGEKMADLYTQNDVPMVKYIDDYFESIF